MDQLIVFALKSVLLAGAALGLLRIFRHHSASARSVVAHLALLALVLMPVANLFLPPLQFAVPQLADRMVPAPLAPVPPGASHASLSIRPSRAEMPGVVRAIDAASQPSVDDWAVLAYALPAIVLLFITLLAIGRLFILRARASLLADSIWLGALADAQRRMGVGHATALFVSDDLASPISWGLRRPVIILDRETLRLHGQAEAIIAHELAHIARFDWAKLLFARVVIALNWFNPLVWILAREAHQLREEAADDAVLALNVTDTDYAQLLVRTARHQSEGSMLTAHGVAPSRHSLARRIRRVLDVHSARGPAAHRFTLSVAAGTIAFAGPLAALSFDAHGAPMDNLKRRTLPAVVVKTVSMAAKRSTEMIHDSGLAATIDVQVPAVVSEQRPLAALDPLPSPTTTAVNASSGDEQKLAQLRTALARQSGVESMLRETEGDGQERVRLLTQLSDQGDVEAMYWLGRILLGPGVPTSRGWLSAPRVPADTAKAIALLRQVAEASDSIPAFDSTRSGHAMFLLAQVYDLGRTYDFGVGTYGVPRDPAEAATWYRRWAQTVPASFATRAPYVAQMLARLDTPAFRTSQTPPPFPPGGPNATVPPPQQASRASSPDS